MQHKTSKKISLPKLDMILKQHFQWLQSSGNRGQRAELNGIDLSDHDLFGAILTRAIIQDVDFNGANLENVNFRGAHYDPEHLREKNCRRCTFNQDTSPVHPISDKKNQD